MSSSLNGFHDGTSTPGIISSSGSSLTQLISYNVHWNYGDNSTVVYYGKVKTNDKITANLSSSGGHITVHAIYK